MRQASLYICFHSAAGLTSTSRSSVFSRSEERRVGKECRSRRDWSSDVFSSDLTGIVEKVALNAPGFVIHLLPFRSGIDKHFQVFGLQQIGRASCRERV